jgi:hypothetical protein
VTRAAVAVALAGLALAATAASARADALSRGGAALAAAVDRAESCARADVDAMLAALPGAETTSAAADALFTVARACETSGGDPSIALELYQRILRDHPDERAAVGANIRAPALVALIGPGGEGADAARRFAAMRAATTGTPDAKTLAEADALARASWPGAGEAALWRADRLRELARHGEAGAGYDDVVARFPGTPWARRAAEGGAAMAIARNKFADARARIAALPGEDPADAAVKEDLTEQLDNRELRIGWYHRAWFILAGVMALLLGSLLHATRSVKAALRALRPPSEVLFAAPIALVLIAMSLTSNSMIGPAVTIICLGGISVAWLSGAALVAGRDLPRPGLRALAHGTLALLGVLSVAYIAIMRTDLLEMLIETVQFGPEH